MKSESDVDTMRENRDRDSAATIMFATIIIFLTIHQTIGFNYDYASSCARPYRSGRTNMGNIAPCDLSKQAYCSRPGSTYPWHAVRRFVHENQGLMRRMYGEQRHITVLKTEIENNELDSDVYDVPLRDSSYARYSKDRDILNTKFVYSKRPTGRSGESYTAPHFRPVQTTPTTSTTTLPKDTKKERNETEAKESQKMDDKSQINRQTYSSTTKESNNDEKIAAYKTSFFEDEMDIKEMNKNNFETNKIEPEIISLEAAIKQTLETNGVYPNYGGVHKNASFYSTTLSETIETSPTDTTTPEYMTPQETTASQDFVEESTNNNAEEDSGWKPVMMDKISTLPPTMLFSQSVKDDQNKNDRIDSNTDSYKGQIQSQNPTTNTQSNVAANMEGQLYQDVVQEDVKPIVKLRGVNACPVKEEVVAPFWANNTRGEVLALLNLYPFEQYVHWEKCVHEHKQMFCREGCRCEQQYRLHRLLAYDPNNECRGIFSDWFRFPSCCVCKCYDMPLEFRVTSRSPRTIEPDIDESVQKEMYEQAASNWYSITLDD